MQQVGKRFASRTVHRRFTPSSSGTLVLDTSAEFANRRRRGKYFIKAFKCMKIREKSLEVDGFAMSSMEVLLESITTGRATSPQPQWILSIFVEYYGGCGNLKSSTTGVAWFLRHVELKDRSKVSICGHRPEPRLSQGGIGRSYDCTGPIPQAKPYTLSMQRRRMKGGRWMDTNGRGCNRVSSHAAHPQFIEIKESP